MADNPSGIVTVFPPGGSGLPNRKAIDLDSEVRVLLTNLSEFDLGYVLNASGSTQSLPANNSIFLQARTVDIYHPGNQQLPGNVRFEVFSDCA